VETTRLNESYVRAVKQSIIKSSLSALTAFGPGVKGEAEKSLNKRCKEIIMRFKDKSVIITGGVAKSAKPTP
jgi:tRNA A37 threonylcarbamoyltransferase TsaD